MYPPEILNEICDGAHALGLKVHLDGARVFNAATRLNRPVAEITAKCDTVMFCLSKGLGAPAGSMLVGKAEAIARGRLYRKRLGGGMRQVGVLGAAGLIALEEMPGRLCEDHENAAYLAEALDGMAGIRVTHRVETNIVIFDVSGTGLAAAEISARLRARGVLINPVNATLMRAVTHLDVSREQCGQAIEVLGAALAG